MNVFPVYVYVCMHTYVHTHEGQIKEWEAPPTGVTDDCELSHKRRELTPGLCKCRSARKNRAFSSLSCGFY